MVVNIYRNKNYGVSETDTGSLIGYKPSNPEAGYISSLMNRLYREVLMAEKRKKPSPAQRKAGAKKNAAALKNYLHAGGENRVKGWTEYAVSKKQIPLTTNRKDYAVGMGFGPLEEGGKDYYTSLVIPAPAEGGVKPLWGEIGVMPFLGTVAEFGEKAYKSVTDKLIKHSKLWAKLLRHLKVKRKTRPG